MPKYILAMDQGTTSSRAILFDNEGIMCGVEQQEYPQLFPQPAWVEHAPEDIWTSQIGVVAKLLRNKNLTASDIAAIGITNQRETAILWDRKTGRPVANAIVWQDRRTAPLCEELRAAGYTEFFQARTGLPIDPYFSGTKIRWMLDNIPGLRERSESGEIAFGTVDSFLMWRLTGGKAHLTDISNASRTLLFNIRTQEWDIEILRLLDIPLALLPEVRPSSSLYAMTTPALFGGEVPIAGIAGDQQAATFGQACLSEGMAKNTYGTGAFLLMNTGETPQRSRHGLLTTVAWKIGEKVTYALEGSVFVAGAAVQWLRDELQILRDSSEIEVLAASVSDSGGVYFVPAFAGLGAPYWDPYARGALLGLTRGTGRAQIARATLEAVCFQTCEVLEAMRADCGLTIPELRVDGGMTVDNLMLQMQADILGVPVVRPAIRETTALGAAYLAGLAVGYWKDVSDIGRNWKADRTFEPTTSAEQRAERLGGWRHAVERARNWAL